MSDDQRVDPVYKCAFVAITAVGFLMRLACFTGLIGSDDLVYSRFAQEISNLTYVPESIHYALRYGLIIPVGLIYRIFGVHEWTTILAPLIASTACVPLIMLIGKRLAGMRGALIAGVLLASFPVALLYSTILVPEPVAGFYILVGLLLYLESDDSNPIFFGVGSGLILGISYVTKEPAAFVAMAVFFDAVIRRRWKAAVGVGIGAAAIVATELAYYLATTGDVLYRFHAMKIHEETPMVLIVNQNLRYRLLESYPRLMLLPNTSFGIHSIVALVALIGLYKWRPPRMQLLLLWAIIPLGYLNFGSSSLSHYTALPVGDRYLEFCYAPLFLITGYVLDHWIADHRKILVTVCAALAVISAAGIWCGYVERQQGWLTADVAVLRKIASEAAQKNLTHVKYIRDPDRRWEESMAILAPKLLPTEQIQDADFVIGPDEFGLPSAISATKKSAPQLSNPN
ncbi:MAG TPA: glycosyltransferase family 39 protein [Candidatus Acidoferrum sp.]|nr:glycosyltransferase family 39 protein [Candidatus Acidoferrum sp.]